MIRRKTEPPRGLLKSIGDPGRHRHMRYHASPDLDRYVEHYWLVEWDLRGKRPELVETLPHPSVHMIFESKGRSRIVGPARAKFSRTLRGRGGVFSVKFRPAGFQPFAGGSISRFSDRTVRLREVFGRQGEDLNRAVLAEGADASRIAVVEGFLSARRPQRPDENVARLSEIVATAAAQRDILRVDDLVGRFGLNKRTLQRLFVKYVGVSPKWVIQRYRLHEAAERLAGGSVKQLALAIELGYSDQAHFIRDFKAIIGVSPAAFARARQERPRGARVDRDEQGIAPRAPGRS